jgi:hypothetical protein
MRADSAGWADCSCSMQKCDGLTAMKALVGTCHPLLPFALIHRRAVFATQNNRSGRFTVLTKASCAKDRTGAR